MKSTCQNHFKRLHPPTHLRTKPHLHCLEMSQRVLPLAGTMPFSCEQEKCRWLPPHRSSRPGMSNPIANESVQALAVQHDSYSAYNMLTKILAFLTPCADSPNLRIVASHDISSFAWEGRLPCFLRVGQIAIGA